MHTRFFLLALLFSALPASAAGATHADFVGSHRCGRCHEPEWRAWRTSDHYRSMLPANEGTVLGDFGDRRFEYGGLSHHFFRRDGGFYVETDDGAGNLQAFEISYTFGHRPLQQYLIQFPDGRYQALGIAWDSRPAQDGGQRWFHLYPDPAVTHGDLLHWTGSFQNWNSRCATCHSTGLEKRYRPETDRYDTRWAEIDVACEACHGPGRSHANWAGHQADAPDPGFANAVPPMGTWAADPQRPIARRLDRETHSVQIGICADCHSRRTELAAPVPGKPFNDLYQLRLLEDGLYYPDGQVEDEVYVTGSFLQSRMYRAGVACTDCHDPHSGELRAQDNALCARCHRSQVFDRPAHHHHAADSAGARCVSCHMPATTYMGVDARRDHGFRIPEPVLSIELGVPNACNACHHDRSARWAADRLAAWFPDAGPRATWAPVLAAAHGNRRDALPGLLAIASDAAASGILRATALAETARFATADTIAAARDALNDPDPLVRAAAARALGTLPPDQRWALLKSRAADPVRSVRAELANQLADVPPDRLSATERSMLRRLLDEYRETLEHNMDMPEGAMNLGLFLARSGRPAEAERAYRRALRLAPAFVPAMINLADLYRSLGLDPAAASLLEDAVQRAPDNAPAAHALGLLRVRQGRLDAAVELLGRAARLDPLDSRYAYVFAVALHEQGHPAAAIGVLQAALRRHPGDPDIAAALRAYRAEQQGSE